MCPRQVSASKAISVSGSVLPEKARVPRAAAGREHPHDFEKGITRLRRGKGFCYRDPSGRPVRDPRTLARIRSLAVPPAWTRVWICPGEKGHLQATGRDARGRKQYRYHPLWTERQGLTKFGRLYDFGLALPRIRRTLAQHLRMRGLPREKVLAAVVSLLEKSLIRIGNDEYAETNGSHGLTTFQDHHATVRGGTIDFRFQGKSGRQHGITVADPVLADIVRKCRRLHGEELFQYTGKEGDIRDVTSRDVNAYLRDISGGDFTAKDFRTWAGTVLAVGLLEKMPPGETLTQKRRLVNGMIREVAIRLGNTPAVCRKSYILPEAIAAWMEGRFAALASACQKLSGRTRQESLVLSFLGPVRKIRTGTR